MFVYLLSFQLCLTNISPFANRKQNSTNRLTNGHVHRFLKLLCHILDLCILMKYWFCLLEYILSSMSFCSRCNCGQNDTLPYGVVLICSQHINIRRFPISNTFVFLLYTLIINGGIKIVAVKYSLANTIFPVQMFHLGGLLVPDIWFQKF